MASSRIIISLLIVFAVLVVCTAVFAQQPDEHASQVVMRVGTFDSRAVAVAYARSENFMKHIRGLMDEYEKAKAAGDEKRVKELEAEGPAMQEMIHKQGFSTWPVDDILEQIQDKIPEIAKQAKVDVIVSKWDIVYQLPGVEFVDVTDLLVVPFNPTKETLDIIKSLKEQEPVSLKELEEHGSD